jgi:hypothetical protein
MNRETFWKLVSSINAKASLSSNPNTYWDTEEYKTITKGGRESLPFIIEDLISCLNNKGDESRNYSLGPLWSKALKEITGHSVPYKLNSREFYSYWIGWYESRTSNSNEGLVLILYDNYEKRWEESIHFPSIEEARAKAKELEEMKRLSDISCVQCFSIAEEC